MCRGTSGIFFTHSGPGRHSRGRGGISTFEMSPGGCGGVGGGSVHERRGAPAPRGCARVVLMGPVEQTVGPSSPPEDPALVSRTGSMEHSLSVVMSSSFNRPLSTLFHITQTSQLCSSHHVSPVTAPGPRKIKCVFW